MNLEANPLYREEGKKTKNHTKTDVPELFKRAIVELGCL